MSSSTPRRVTASAMSLALLIVSCGDERGDTATTAASFTGAQATLQLVVSGIDRPLEIAWHRDPSVAYVATQGGLVRPVRGSELGAPVLDLSASVATDTVEQGLLGLAFHPTDDFAYIDYTRADGDTVIAEYPVLPDGTFDTDAARTVMVLDQPSPSHNGGNLTFGPDGNLYIGMGDGGPDDDPDRRSLDLADPLGKILRIDPRPSGDQPYGIPDDNPFVDVAGALPEIWAIGVRNPWRFSFDPATGDLWVGDVGQNDWEEITVARADETGSPGGRGANFGWSAFEASHPFNVDQQAPDALPPVYEYPHGDDGCAVAGGVVYHGTAIASMAGWYVFGDWCSGKVWAMPADLEVGATVDVGQLQLIGRPGTVAAVRAGPDGELYVVGFTTGTVHRVAPA